MHAAFQLGSETVGFEFHRKQTVLGSLPIDHWWLPITQLYGQRQNRSAPQNNRTAIMKGFWGLVRDVGNQQEPELGETYLLGRIVPLVRSQGSRRIFADAFLRTRSQDASNESRQLDEMIRSSAKQGIDEREFHARSKRVLGKPEIDPADRARKNAMANELLSTAVALLTTDEESAVAHVEATWTGLMRTIARRSMDATTTFCLDAISYEARAAFHRAYSAVWHEIVPLLHKDLEVSTASARFLNFWHTEPCRETAEPEKYFDVFHGHVFGLHPAGAAFISTEAGRSLVGDWLEVCERDKEIPTSILSIPAEQPELAQQAYHRLLNGLLVAVYDYERRLSDVASLRRR